MITGWYGGADQEPPWWAFWFISVLFFTTVLRRFLERFPSAVAWAVGLAGLAWAHLVPDSAIARTPLGVGLALPCHGRGAGGLKGAARPLTSASGQGKAKPCRGHESTLAKKGQARALHGRCDPCGTPANGLVLYLT